ncbi:hypothetical protein O181_051967 [Austropuccinia psidii MF-1]|uniref:DNA-(apurinic or apyrimidinic site) endonuclease n=1 Tax=Austropuccinia psidii MF-1 TaxID=1389203 RepID=A0A9Q3E6P5_9BASI|nr:hypothetical protein [Austropuccinia psidii MF-1]
MVWRSFSQRAAAKTISQSLRPSPSARWFGSSDASRVVAFHLPTMPASEKSKRKVKSEDVEEKAPKAKKAKGPVVPLHDYLPTNRTFPEKLQFPPKADKSLRISTWNVCGVNACEKKGLKTYLTAEDPDIMIMSETKTQAEPDIMHIKHQYKYRYWGGDPIKGYAGVAILSKHKPLDVVYGLPTATDPASTAGRMIMLEFSTFYLIGTYTPNAGDQLKYMDRKKEWNVSFEKYLRELDSKKPVIWGGDINCALTEKDIRNAATNWNKSAGYTQVECDGLNSQLNPSKDSGHQKLVDVWRHLHPELEGHYTYYSYRFGAREKGIGWRIDSFIISERVVENTQGCEIRHECYGASDHVPVVLEITLAP